MSWNNFVDVERNIRGEPKLERPPIVEEPQKKIKYNNSIFGYGQRTYYIKKIENFIFYKIFYKFFGCSLEIRSTNYFPTCEGHKINEYLHSIIFTWCKENSFVYISKIIDGPYSNEYITNDFINLKSIHKLLNYLREINLDQSYLNNIDDQTEIKIKYNGGVWRYLQKYIEKYGYKINTSLNKEKILWLKNNKVIYFEFDKDEIIILNKNKAMMFKLFT